MSNKILALLVLVVGLAIGGIEYNRQSPILESAQPINPVAPRIEAPQPKVEPQPTPPPAPPPQKQNPRRGNGGGSC